MTIRRWCRAIGVAAWVAAAGPAGAQAYEPNEVKISAHRGMIDFELSQSRAKVAHTDPEGRLWLADIDRSTGDFVPWHGRGQLIAEGTVSKANMFKWNGPEWVAMASGDQLHFSYYRGGAPAAPENTRMALAVQAAGGAWLVQPLGPTDQARMAHVTSRDRGDANPRIKYLDKDLNHYVRDLLDGGSERRLDFLPRNNKAWRFASGWRSLMYTRNVDGGRQVFAYLLDSDEHQQLTTDGGHKDVGQSVPWAWRAPEFGGDYVLATVVDYSELRIYRRVQVGGYVSWNAVFSGVVPDGRTIGSPEWFVYNDKSYLSLAVFKAGDSYPSEVWVSNIDAADPVFRRVTLDDPVRVRNDPEVFITANGPFVYYNRYDPGINPDNPLCNDCSEGVFRADMGLKGR